MYVYPSVYVCMCEREKVNMETNMKGNTPDYKQITGGVGKKGVQGLGRKNGQKCMI